MSLTFRVRGAEKNQSLTLPFISVLYKVIMSRAFVFLNCDVGKDQGIISELKDISGVSRAIGVSGIYDIVADISSDSEAGLAKTVRRFRSLANIRSCLTMIVAEKPDIGGK